MKKQPTILIVEDDMIIGANLALQLKNSGYDISGILSRGEEAVDHVLNNTPDILLLDINLKGALNGIETARSIQKVIDIPIIYLTANNDAKTFEKAKATHPMAFITKPFNKLNLQRAVALVVEQLKEEEKEPQVPIDMHVLNDRIFIRHNGKMEKLLLSDILYVEADRNYATVVTPTKKYLLSSTLKVLEEKLPNAIFLRIHRSYMVNISKLDVVSDTHIEINRKVIPISRSHKEHLFARIHTI
ncbi:LytR/AlgR family response regulator transcription factor [Pareuzebyella sediminis]|uniref:LytR/AlgR family response regulator transcription factor n=1 Tax=Pareuzebyella sediminis TaxID=2607998 RepID=UPI0011ED686F|nr:response regulator [Pareuzebyella sediminis]